METTEKVPILLVDDNPSKLMTFETILADLDEELVKARSGREALRHLLHRDFAAVVMDVKMPDMDGFETAAAIRERPRDRHTPILFVTASVAEDDLRVRGYRLGAVDFLFVPVAVEILRAKVRAYAQMFRYTRQAERQAAQLAALNEALEAEVMERRRAEEAARQAREEAERANRAKSEFLSRMSHELRTPLNAILGFAQLLQMDAHTPGQRESVEHILKGGRHLLDLINEVLEITRIETGRLHLSLEAVPVADLVRETMDLIRPLAAQRGLRLELGAGPPDDGHVQGDRQRLKQVLLNLLTNAIKYNQEGGTVTVACEPVPGERLRLRVTDTGPGIPPALLDRLFIPFDRLGAEQTGVDGTGLGLALSKHLIEAMGGTVGVESTVGQGSTFWVELSVAAAPAPRPEGQAAEAPAPAPAPAATILYVEDNLSNLRLIECVLAHRPGLKLLPAMQGRLGLALAQEHRPALILLDLHLPDVPGHEVLRHLQGDARTRDIPVVVISADAMPGQVARVLAAGARDYLTKPLDVQRLLALVDEVLGRAGRQAQRAEGGGVGNSGGRKAQGSFHGDADQDERGQRHD